jgi:hypothetical protein
VLITIVAAVALAGPLAGSTVPSEGVTEEEAVATFTAQMGDVDFVACGELPDVPGSFRCYGWMYNAEDDPADDMIVSAVVGRHVNGNIVVGQYYAATAGDELPGPPSQPASASTTLGATTSTAAPAAPAQGSDAAVLAAGEALNADKSAMQAMVTDASSSVETVDVINWDPATATLRIAVTSGFNTEEYRDEVAWAIASSLGAQYWGPDGELRNDAGTVKPGLSLQVDSTTYVAPYDLMAAIGDVNISSTDWLTQVRQ